jgi:hypothetical protein
MMADIQNLGGISARIQANEHGVLRRQNIAEVSQEAGSFVSTEIPCKSISLSGCPADNNIFQSLLPMLDPRERMHLCLSRLAGCFSHARPSS